MILPPDDLQKDLLRRKREHLMSLWAAIGHHPENSLRVQKQPATAPDLQKQPDEEHGASQPDEILEMFQRFANPNADKLRF